MLRFCRVNNYSEIPNKYIEFGVEPKNNTVHQKFNQFVQSTGQLLQHNQLSQSPVNYIYQEFANYSQKMTSPTTVTMALETQRPIIIDGLNVGYAHGRHKAFSAKGMVICSKYFTRRGFKSVKIMLPQHYRGKPGTNNHSTISVLTENDCVYFTPSRKIQDARLTCYTDRILLDHAITCGGVVVSNDNFRDLYAENIKYREIIENRHIMFMFIEDEIVIPSDQYGHRYPTLDASTILNFPA